MVRLGRKGDLIKKGDDPQEPYHIPVQPKDEESEVRPLGLTGPVDNGKEENEEPILTGSAVVPQTTTIPELVLRVAKKKGKSRKKDLIAGVLEENPTLGSNSIGVAISRMAKRGDLVRTQRGRFPLFGPPKEPETTPTEPELQFDETGTPMKSRPPEPEWAEQLRRQHDNAL